MRAGKPIQRRAGSPTKIIIPSRLTIVYGFSTVSGRRSAAKISAVPRPG
jgi:hypothetical protein